MSEPPLVMHVIHHLVVGGMENGLVNLINHMPADAYRHVVVCVEDFSDFRQRIRRPDVEVIALHRSQTGAAAVRKSIFTLCRMFSPTIVHARNMSGLDALVPSRLAGVPFRVHGEHGWDVDNLDGLRWKPRLLRRLHAPFVDRYITVSKDLQRFLTARVGIRESRITQIYNGVDTDRFAPADAPRDESCLPPAFRGPDKLRFGTVGRIQPVKDQATLLRAFAALLSERPHLRERARLVILGNGPLLADLRALAESLGVADLAWLPGASDAVHSVLRALDVFVLSSLNEGISNTILEAMACGLPVLATAVGGNVELVEQGVTGALFQPGDQAALTRSMVTWLEQPDVRRQLGHQARQRVLDRFSLDAMVAGYRAVYDGLRQGRTG